MEFQDFNAFKIFISMAKLPSKVAILIYSPRSNIQGYQFPYIFNNISKQTKMLMFLYTPILLLSRFSRVQLSATP